MMSPKPNYRRTLGFKFYLWEMVVTELSAVVGLDAGKHEGRLKEADGVF